MNDINQDAYLTGRRRFLETVVASGAGLLLPAANWAQATQSNIVKNPYSNVNWESFRHVGSGSHIHCRSQRVLEVMHRRGMRHLAISNYYPSAPCTIDERIRQFQVEQSFATLNQGGYTTQNFRWNDILTDPETGWSKSLSPQLQEEIPFKIGPPVFHDIPSDVVICPNAEHHSTTDNGGHFNSLGSTFSSGTFDVRNKFKLHEHGYLLGLGMPWREAFDRILEQLIHPAGGGITINHPVWSRQSLDSILEMLDYDPRVLGIEIWNQTCQQLNGKGWALDLWDAVLKTGRRCFGFSVSDHVQSTDPDFWGYNMLLIDPHSSAQSFPQDCLNAYRQGQFYCVLQGKLRFNVIRLQNEMLTVETNAPCRIRIISGAGQVMTQEGQSLKWALPNEVQELARHRYLRVEAEEMQGKDRIFSQPIHLV